MQTQRLPLQTSVAVLSLSGKVGTIEAARLCASGNPGQTVAIALTVDRVDRSAHLHIGIGFGVRSFRERARERLPAGKVIRAP